MKVKVVGYSCLLLLVWNSCCCYHQIVKNYLEFVSRHLRKAPWNLFAAILYTLQTAQIQPTQAKFNHRPKASRTSGVPLRGVTNLLNEATMQNLVQLVQNLTINQDLVKPVQLTSRRWHPPWSSAWSPEPPSPRVPGFDRGVGHGHLSWWGRKLDEIWCCILSIFT